ncbi:carboxypeptidase regulatory-like domain-containing protein [Sphingomonas sp.]|uniref:carboxypeptidase regulatory-like domain-containing protein n=1 Tax=Sphingomonas sp. TaxID=28214 RepID=UPI0035BBB3C1
MNDAVLAALLIVAVAVAWARLAFWQARAPIHLRARGWRVALLAAMQALCAALLYLTLVPPPTPGSAATLVVATAHAPRLAGSANTIVALPEAPAIAGAERVPDLATALRRHPGTTRLHIVGAGLEARDRSGLRGMSVAFDPPAEPRGLVRLDAPAPIAPGGEFQVVGRVARVPGGWVELRDPAGTVVDQRPLSPAGDFVLTGAARVAGVALVRIRVRAPDKAVVEAAALPIRTSDDSQPRLLLLAGAPGPEIKYLRRWATDAGLAVTTLIAAGGGVVLGDAAPAVDAATLARFDAVVVDERSWAGLGGGQRAAMAAAVRGGMGLVVRITGPVASETRRAWGALGLSIGNAATAATAPLADGVPALTRRIVGTTPNAVAVWRDARGAILSDWRAAGRGRVALWRVDNAFALVPSGHGDRYGNAWGETLAAVSRPRTALTVDIPPLPRAGERMTLCRLDRGARVDFPGDDAVLAIDPASGPCAGYWPQRPGWHRLIDHGVIQPFYVYPADALPGVRAHDRAEATVALRRMSALPVQSAPDERGASWPWFLALVAALGALWWIERARWGRRSIAPQTGANSA